MKKFLIAFLFCLVAGAAYAVCADGEFDADGTCVESKFQLTTVNLTIEPGAENVIFLFSMSPSGTFYVDCGADGTLDGTGVSGKTIVRGSVTLEQYSCTYTTGGVKTIQFGGLATGYSTNVTVSTIQFGSEVNGNNFTSTLVGGISGSLGAIFPTLGNNNGEQPRFYETFYDCSNMTGIIPLGLFNGISGQPTRSMFNSTFSNCSGLTGSIPAGLFGNISGAPITQLFMKTFYNCSRLTGSIPATLFSGISGLPANQMFSNTFNGCSGLTGSIPANLFSGISGAPAPNMFVRTFDNCRGLTGQIPANLFSGISGEPSPYMFMRTFENCRGLNGVIPPKLFGNLTGSSANYMFNGTFYGCTNLTGYVPSTLFAGITGTAQGMMTDLFKNTGIYTSCPCGTTPYITGFESDWTNKVSCVVALKSNEHWNNGVCTTDCQVGGTKLKTLTGLEYPILSDYTTEHSINIGYDNGGVCHVPLSTGIASGNIHVLLNGVTYHATVPDEIVPTGFTGQPE